MRISGEPRATSRRRGSRRRTGPRRRRRDELAERRRDGHGRDQIRRPRRPSATAPRCRGDLAGALARIPGHRTGCRVRRGEGGGVRGPGESLAEGRRGARPRRARPSSAAAHPDDRRRTGSAPAIRVPRRARSSRRETVRMPNPAGAVAVTQTRSPGRAIVGRRARHGIGQHAQRPTARTRRAPRGEPRRPRHPAAGPGGRPRRARPAREGEHEHDRGEGDGELGDDRAAVVAEPRPSHATVSARRTRSVRMPRTSSLRMITTSSPAKATAAIVAIAYSAVAAPVSSREEHAARGGG